MKCLIATFCSALLIASYCSAQEIPDVEEAPNPRPPVRPPTSRFDVTFRSTDTFNMIINGRDYGTVAKSKTIKLPLGNYKFFFESLESGETINKRFFRLTRDSLTNGKYILAINFKQPDL